MTITSELRLPDGSILSSGNLLKISGDDFRPAYPTEILFEVVHIDTPRNGLVGLGGWELNPADRSHLRRIGVQARIEAIARARVQDARQDSDVREAGGSAPQ